MPGICSLSLIPIRKEPTSKSEMETQLLFGELFELLEKQASWSLIRTFPDHCEGWIANDQLTLIDDEFAKSYQNQLRMISDNTAVALEESLHIPVILLKGSLLPYFTDNTFKIGTSIYSYKGSTIKYPADFNSLLVPGIALNYLNCPFLWGGRSPLGIDDSGLIQMAWKFCGIEMPRDASSQAKLGELVDFAEEAKPGDLAFFDDDQGSISHVGIILGEGRIIHAAGRVKIDKIDHQGIFNAQLNGYTHKLRIIKHIQ